MERESKELSEWLLLVAAATLGLFFLDAMGIIDIKVERPVEEEATDWVCAGALADRVELRWPVPEDGVCEWDDVINAILAERAAAGVTL